MNVAASIKDRLQSAARAEGRPLNELLDQFALSRFFARLGESEYADQFILKGAQLFVLWAEMPHRPTRDADFLSFGSSDPKDLESIFDRICQQPSTPPDGLDWLPATASPIREDNIYDGVRVKLLALLGKVRIPVQIDVGFGDSITPSAGTAEWRTPLNFPATRLLVYPPETVIAEKLQAAVVLEMGNSRMKDFFDLFWICRHLKFDGPVLREAIEATFERRKTPIPTDTPIALSEIFFASTDKQTQWSAFLRKSELEFIALSEVIEKIAEFLLPVLRVEVSASTWDPVTGWAQKGS